MKLFTVGPVEMYPETLKIEGTQQPYFRTPEFSSVMKDIEIWFLKSLNASSGTEFVGLTSSGTGAMDATVSNLLSKKDKVLVINGGSFGLRFAQMCGYYGIPFETYNIAYGEAFDKEKFEAVVGKGFTALLVNACETSTGQKYDLDYLGTVCKQRGMLYVVDAVSAYLADEIDMERQGIDALITASQKALALAPGVAMVALSENAKLRLGSGVGSFYFDFQSYIENQRRGQPPFTSAVGTMLALHERLRGINARGVEKVNLEHKERAVYFRSFVRNLPLEIPTIPLSNSVTPIIFPNENATEIYERMKNKYGIFLTPSGGDWKDKQLRVGHLGNLKLKDYDDLIEKLGGELQ